MKIAILGFGIEGKSLFKFLKRQKPYRGAEIKVLDQKSDKNYLDNLDQFDLVFRSPGVPYNLPEIQKAIKRGVKFSSATKLFFDLCRAPIIGVTGTKGKGTTSTLIYKTLKAMGKKVLLAGNIGRSPLEILSKVTKDTLVVLELSSFQLWDLEKSPQVAVITEVFPDHQDIHKNLKEYLDAKTNICCYQKKSDSVFYFQNNQPAIKMAGTSIGKKIPVAAPDTLKKNKILAASVVRQLGCPEKIIRKTIANFRGLEHRLEFIREINGIRFFNDSASTNPQTTAAAILSFKQPLILIAGGKDKNLDYQPLAEAIRESKNVKEIVLIGENKVKIEDTLSGIMEQKCRIIKKVTDLKSAVKSAYQAALPLIRNSSLIILFSPGAASFDMFKDYKDRGRQFKKFVRMILN